MELHRLSDPYYSLAGLKEEGHGVWSLGVHDNHYSNVSCISLTYDDQYLLTGAGNGNVLYIKLYIIIYQQTVQPQLLSRSVLYTCALCTFFLCEMKSIFVLRI